jgi:hypothetical protein
MSPARRGDDTDPPRGAVSPVTLHGSESKRMAERSHEVEMTEELRKKFEQGIGPDDLEGIVGSADFQAYAKGMGDQMSDEPVRTATTSQLKAIFREGERMGFNRQVPAGVEAKLRGGPHLLSPVLVHEFIEEKPAEPHWRCEVLARMDDRAKPERRFLLDVATDRLNKLPLLNERRKSKANQRWELILESQGELEKLWRSDFGEACVAGLVHSTHENESKPAATLFADTLHRSTPFWVSREMTTLVEAAAESMPSYELDPADLLAVPGFAVFERPLSIEFPTGDERAMGVDQISGLAWGFITIEGPGGTEQAGLYITAFNDREVTQDRGYWSSPAGRQVQELMDERGLGRYYPCHFTSWPTGQLAGEPQLTDKDWHDAIVAVRKITAALWLLSGQRLAQRTAFKPPRAERRRAERLHLPGEVQVITLRRSAVKIEAGEGSPVEWSHRWLVTGHWRRRWNDDEQRIKLIWVSPYIKGPEDKPFVPRRRIYRVSR